MSKHECVPMEPGWIVYLEWDGFKAIDLLKRFVQTKRWVPAHPLSNYVRHLYRQEGWCDKVLAASKGCANQSLGLFAKRFFKDHLENDA